MWIIPKNIQHQCLVSALVTEGLNWDLNDWGYLCAQSLTWRGKDSPARTWLRRWKRVNWLQRLSTRTLKPSHTQTFVDQWISSLPGTRASHFPQPAQDEVKTTPATCGRTLQEEFSFADPDGCSAKTSKDTLRWDSPQSSVIWKKWVTDRRGEYSRRLKLVRPTNGNGSLSWLTPVTPAPHDSENLVGNPNIKRRQKELCHQVSEASMWPTASARDYKDTPGMSKERDGRELGRIDQLPRAVYHYTGPPDREKLNKGGRSQEQWRTPAASEAGAKVETLFTKEGKPARPGRRAYRRTPSGKMVLQSQTINQQVEMVEGINRAQGKLNPNWVEQLMGLEVGWTQLPTEWTD